MKHKTFDRIFFKYLISYLLILLIPILFINGLFGHRFIHAYKKEIQAQADADLAYLGEMIDTELQTISTTVDQMHMSMDFTGYSFPDNPLKSHTYLNRMSVYSITNPLISEIGIYLRGEDYMFINQSTCRVDLFLKSMYQFEKTSPEEMEDLLLHSQRRTVLPQQQVTIPGKSESYLIILEPLYTDYQTVRGVCLFFIRTSDLAHLVESRLGKYEAHFVIQNQDEEILFSTSQMPEHPYFKSQYRSSQFGGLYTAYMPESQKFVDKINILTRELLLTTLLVLLISGIVISFLMRMNYSPIRKLKDKASSLVQPHNRPLSGNELETISTTLDFLSDQNHYLADKLKNSTAAIKSGRIHHLLTGHYMSREDFNMDAEDLNMGYQHNWFFVAVIQIHGNVEDYDALALFMQKSLSSSIECFYTFTPEPDKIILINGIEKETGTQKEIEHLLKQLRQNVKEHFPLDITIGVGKLYSGTRSIPRSYLEARSALDYRFVKGNGTAILFQNLIAQEHEIIPYPKYPLEQLRSAIDVSDYEKIQESVHNLIDYIEKKKLPLFAAKGICFDILSTFIEKASSVNSTLPDVVDLSKLMHMETVDDVITLIQEMSAQMEMKPQENQKQDSDILLEELKTYIASNCLRCEFSIQETAEHFHMLLPNLSQFFKEKTGRNILDYSTELRMKRAKELLADPKIPLKDISQQVGYYNVSSFIRRFKQIQGITPGDYRKFLAGKENHYQ